MDHSDLTSLINELQELNERFKLGLTMFVEGAQGFHGNLRLLIDPSLYQEFDAKLDEFLRRYGLTFNYCVRAHTVFVLLG